MNIWVYSVGAEIAFTVKLLSDQCLRSSLMSNEKSKLVKVMAWCYQANSRINWSDVDPDLYHHMASLGYNNELMTVTQCVLRDMSSVPL